MTSYKWITSYNYDFLLLTTVQFIDFWPSKRGLTLLCSWFKMCLFMCRNNKPPSLPSILVLLMSSTLFLNRLWKILTHIPSPFHAAEISSWRRQLWQGVHQDGGGTDAHRQALHHEPGPERVSGILLHQPWIHHTSLRSGPVTGCSS